MQNGYKRDLDCFLKQPTLSDLPEKGSAYQKKLAHWIRQGTLPAMHVRLHQHRFSASQWREFFRAAKELARG